MALYEALYGRRCRSPVGWFELGEASLLVTDMVQDASEKVKLIPSQLRTVQSRQKNSYMDRKVHDFTFMVGERVFFWVSPMKGFMRFRKKGKLIPRYIGPFEILKRVGEVAYKLALLPRLSAVHLVFHISMLRKYHDDPSYVLHFSSFLLEKYLSYVEEPVVIFDRQVRKSRSKSIASVKVQWRGHPVEEATWETEHDMCSRYPHLFTTSGSWCQVLAQVLHTMPDTSELPRTWRLQDIEI
ncbi:uncharacterized protein [Nicotiana sylvestris]|uniref:uncharacterized protein n=1 Tax=Nicotiana sylvestris TaxID=4096 RepID=UPI00388C7708